MGALRHQQLAGGFVGDVPGHIHGNAAHHVQHGFEGVHVDGHVIVHRQLEHLIDFVGNVVDEVVLIRPQRVHAVDLAGGAGAALGLVDVIANVAVPRDLQHVDLAVVPVHLHVQDHVGVALALGVVAAAVVGVVVDAQQQQVVKACAAGLNVLVGDLVQLAGLAGVEYAAHILVDTAHGHGQNQHHHQHHRHDFFPGGCLPDALPDA